ncbi:unnamed protein product [Caenorhabditis brenneri]
MNAALLVMYNPIINTTANGFSLVLPAIPAATSDENPSTSNSAATVTSNHKAEKERERRDKTNERFVELQKLVKPDYSGKMSQANILKATLKAAIKIKREFYSDPRSRGLNAAILKIEEMTASHVESLNFPSCTKFTIAQRVEKMFEDFRDVVLPVFTPKNAPANSTALLTAATEAATSDDADKAKREIIANREQHRRDNQADGFGSLRQFIAENKLVPLGNQKIQTLECMIDFLTSKPTPQPSQTDAVLFKIGFTQGKHLGLNLVASFFKSDVHLFSHTNSLQNFIESQLGDINSSSHISSLKFDDSAITKFKSLHPTVIDPFAPIVPSPTPVPVTIPTTAPLPVQLPASALTKKFFRPWE